MAQHRALTFVMRRPQRQAPLGFGRTVIILTWSDQAARAAAVRLERNTKGLLTCKQRRQGARIGDASHSICSCSEKGSPRTRVHEMRRKTKTDRSFAWALTWPSA